MGENGVFGLFLIANKTTSDHGVCSDGVYSKMQEVWRPCLLDGIVLSERPLRRLCQNRSRQEDEPHARVNVL